MHSCSKLFFWKISNPKMSKNPMNLFRFPFRFLLIFSTYSLTLTSHTHDPIEQLRVQLLRQRVAVLVRLLRFILLLLPHATTQRDDCDCLARAFTHTNASRADRFLQSTRRNAQQLRSLCQHVGVLDLAMTETPPISYLGVGMHGGRILVVKLKIAQL